MLAQQTKNVNSFTKECFSQSEPVDSGFESVDPFLKEGQQGLSLNNTWFHLVIIGSFVED